jgi:ADP-ribosylglycohydrolase
MIDDRRTRAVASLRGLAVGDAIGSCSCAIVGGILGARLGLDGVPPEWLRRCEPLPDWLLSARPGPGLR